MYMCISGPGSDRGRDHSYPPTFRKDLIITILITITVESVVVLIYSTLYGKPFRPILISSVIVNLLTQCILWIGLNLFFQHYLATLCFAEILIWMIESYLLYRFPANQLRLPDAALLSLFMNQVSFATGLFLPI